MAIIQLGQNASSNDDNISITINSFDHDSVSNNVKWLSKNKFPKKNKDDIFKRRFTC